MNFKQYLTVKNIFFAALLVLSVYFIIQIKEIALLFFGSYVIACSLNPLVDKLSKKMNRAVAAGIVVITTTLTAALFFVPIFIVSIRETIAFAEGLPERIIGVKEFLAHTTINNISLLSMINLDDLVKNTSDIAKNVVSRGFDVTITITAGIAIGFTALMIVFYFLLDKSTIEKRFIRFFPMNIREKTEHILKTIETKVGGYIIAQGLSMTIVGVFTAVGLSILKIKYAIVLGLIAAILDIIPIVGPILAYIIGTLVGLPKGWIFIILIGVVYAAAQWISNQIARPLVFGKFMDMHPLLIIFAFLVAAKFLGVWGVILAPAIASLFTVLIDELYLKTIDSESEENPE